MVERLTVKEKVEFCRYGSRGTKMLTFQYLIGDTKIRKRSVSKALIHAKAPISLD